MQARGLRLAITGALVLGAVAGCSSGGSSTAAKVTTSTIVPSKAVALGHFDLVRATASCGVPAVREAVDEILDGRSDLDEADWPAVKRSVLPKAQVVADDGRALLNELDEYPWPGASQQIAKFKTGVEETRAGWLRIAHARSLDEVVTELRAPKTTPESEAVRTALDATDPDKSDLNRRCR